MNVGRAKYGQQSISLHQMQGIFMLKQQIGPILELFQLKRKVGNPENPYGLVMVFPAVIRKDNYR